jgi:dihydroorotase
MLTGSSEMTNPTTSNADLVILGATVVTDTASFGAGVATKDGQILAIGEKRAMPTARETFDATGSA